MGHKRDDDGLAIKDEESETDYTGTGKDALTESIEGSTVSMKDDHEEWIERSKVDMKDYHESSKKGDDGDEKEWIVLDLEVGKTPKTRGRGGTNMAWRKVNFEMHNQVAFELLGYITNKESMWLVSDMISHWGGQWEADQELYLIEWLEK